MGTPHPHVLPSPRSGVGPTHMTEDKPGQDIWDHISDLARWAPTPHNTQPFRLRVTSENTANLVALPERFLVEEDPGNRYCAATAGILAVALRRAGLHHGVTVTVTPVASFEPAMMSNAHGEVVVAQVSITGSCTSVPQSQLLESRRTSRIPYTGQRITHAAQVQLQSMASAAGHRLQIHDDAGAIETVLDLNADAIMDNLQIHHERREIESWTRVGPAPLHGDGLWNGPLNQPAWELRAAFDLPWLFTLPGFRDFARWRQTHTQQGTPHVGLLSGPFDTWPQLWRAGEMLMELWLAMAHHNVVMQPFGSMLTNPSYAARVANIFGRPDVWLIFRMGLSPMPPRSPRLPTLVLP